MAKAQSKSITAIWRHSSINSTHTDVVLGEDEYKGDDEEADTKTQETQSGTISESDRETFDSIWAELEKENPELFASPTPSTGTTKQGNYQHVGTLDNGQLTNPGSFGQGDYSEGAGLTVY